MNRSKAFSAVLAAMAAAFIFAASPASAATIQARSGGGSSSSSSHSFSSGSGGSGGSHSSSGGSSSSGRGVSAPSNSGGSKSYSSNRSSSSSGRGVSAPSNSSGRAVPLSSRSVIVNPPSAKLSVASSARASGSSYSSGGHTWTYSQASYHSYYTTYHGGYPLFGSVAYWTLFDSPYYAPNYLVVGNPWYQHAYPAGYVLSNGELQQVSQNTPAGSSSFWTIFFIVFAAVALLMGALYAFSRAASGGSNYGGGI